MSARRAAPIVWLAFLAVACRSAPAPSPTGAPTPVADGRHPAFVPTEPPDSEPQWMYAHSNWTTDTARWGGRFTRDVVMLSFRQAATQGERQAAVDAVQGTVVGGKPLAGGPGLGIYLLLLPHDPTNDRLFAAIDALRKMPQVRWAMPNSIWIGTGG